jgi:hypothetical protein
MMVSVDLIEFLYLIIVWQHLYVLVQVYLLKFSNLTYMFKMMKVRIHC